MPSKLDRCVKAVKASGSVLKVNPWAVCKATLQKFKDRRKRKS